MKCVCSNLPDAFYLDAAPPAWSASLLWEEAFAWRTLYSCPECGTLWAIDDWDKYMPQVVNRVKDRSRWTEEPLEETRKQLLLQSRGGTEEETCIWAGCSVKRVKGTVFCVDHLWKMGVRR